MQIKYVEYVKTTTGEKNVVALRELLNFDPRQTQDDLAEKVGIDAMPISCILNTYSGHGKKSARWTLNISSTFQTAAWV